MAEVVSSSNDVIVNVDDVATVIELLKEVDASTYTMPTHMSKIYKDECMYCYHTPFHPGGLYICVKTLTSLCEEHMKYVAEKRGRLVYLHLKSTKKEEESDEPRDKIKRLAIGLEEGFCNEKNDVEDEYYLVIYPRLNIHIPIPSIVNLPIGVVCQRIADSTSAERLELLQGNANAWDGEQKQVTKHADLKQCDNPPQLPMNGWKCDVDGCELRENLWLNLTDGAIRCGRSQFIGDGIRSKGNNHMKMYYDEYHNPLVVKLGTIEENGCADIYSYDEDDAVIDPNLEKHLAHFGLIMKELKKSEKSTVELELDMNQKWEWARCQEDGENLENVYGPYYTGIINIGSSCYINSVIQSLLCIPDFINTLCNGNEGIYDDIDVTQMNDSIIGQCAKLFSSLASGHFSKPPPNVGNGVKPTQFRKVIGRDHPEFSSCKQQDVEEYIRHLIDKIGCNLPNGMNDPTTALRFKLQVRLVDTASGYVRYSNKDEYVLALPIPKCALIPIDNEGVRYCVTLSDCLNGAFGEDTIEGFKSPITGEVKGASTSSAMSTFPDYLVMQIQRFQLADDYTVKKLDVDVIVDDEIDLSPFRGYGPQPGEELLPQDDDNESSKCATTVNEAIVSQLEGMGFSRNASIKATIETKGISIESAAEWIMERMDDPNLNDPPMDNDNKKEEKSQDIDQLVSFGFSRHQAKYALKNQNDVNAAAEWLFNNADQVPEERMEVVHHNINKEIRDGGCRYKLVSFISHMGSSPHSGHYVCHAMRDDRWILFNDEKVAVSKSPPKQLAYLYMYKRM